MIREEAAHYSGNLFDVVEALLIRMQHLDQGVLRIGTIPDHALGYWTHRHTNQVILTAERRRHYLERHPEVASFERDLLLTLIDPDAVHRYERDSAVANLYRRLEDGRYIVASVFISHEVRLANSLLSARISRARARLSGRKRGFEVWER